MRSGDLKSQDALSLVSLARDLDVSVTPVREALSQLQSSGIVESIPNRGFFIPKLSKEEAMNLYQLVASLECLALRNSTFSEQDIEALRKLNELFENKEDAIQRINADIDFHDTLTANYQNSLALKILSELKTRIFFYELDYMSKENFYLDSGNDHKQIITYLEDKNIDKACEALTANWLNIIDYLNL